MPGGPDKIIFRGISSDSRNIRKGELFVALRGENHDGHDFIADAYSKGAAACLVERLTAPQDSGIPLIRVESTLKAFGDMAHEWRMMFSELKLAAITGSNGKTTTKDMASSIVSVKHNNLKNSGNFNNLIGLPITLFELDESYDTAVVEVGMNDYGEIRRLAEIAEPDVGAITNIGRAHLEKLGGIEGVAKAKGELVENFGEDKTFVVNADDQRVSRIADTVNCRKLSFGIASEAASVRAVNIAPEGMTGITFDILYEDARIPVRINTVGMHNVINALCAAGVAIALGCDMDDVREGLEKFEPARMRLQLLESEKGFRVLNDAYNANPESVRSAVDELMRLKGDGKTIAVLGDMLELGEASESEHRSIGKYLSASGVDLVIAMGEHGGALLSGVGNGTGSFFAENHSDASEMVLSKVVPGDLVLVKGSRGMKMERVVSELTGGDD